MLRFAATEFHWGIAAISRIDANGRKGIASIGHIRRRFAIRASVDFFGKTRLILRHFGRNDEFMRTFIKLNAFMNALPFGATFIDDRIAKWARGQKLFGRRSVTTLVNVEKSYGKLR